MSGRGDDGCEGGAEPGAFDAGGSWWGQPVTLPVPPWPGQYNMNTPVRAMLGGDKENRDDSDQRCL